MRIKNSAVEVYSKAIYHIGQTLHHKDSKCRCVVIGKSNWLVPRNVNRNKN